MTDELDDLKAAMKAATPAPDAAKKAADIALARKNFADLQESRDGTRLTSEHPKTGWSRGVRQMLNALNPRAALTATTAIVAVGMLAVIPNWQQGPEGYDFSSTPKPMVVQEEAVATDEVREAITETEPMALPTPKPEGLRKDDTSSLRGEFARSRDQGLADADDGYSGRTALNAAPEALAEIAPGTAAPQASRKATSELQRPAPIDDDVILQPEADTEAFPEADASPLKITAEEPTSTFSIDVDTVSYAVVRSSLTNGQLPPAGAVRIEEMVNYFPYDYPAPDADGAPFQPTVRVTQTPWNPDTQLVHIAIQGEKPAIEDRPPLNLVFLIDTSGSMNQPNKLPLLKQSLSLMLSKLTAQDQVAIVTYAGSAGQVLEPTAATERDTILGALDRLEAGGSTAGQAGLQQAYSVADGMAEEGEVTRVILTTDGDFNVGLSDPEALKDYIADKRESGTYLSVMGFGRGNLDDATMQALAQNGNGQAAFIDTLSEAQKVLVDQVSGALFPIANDVKIQVEFNPAEVAEYRLIGYETRALNREDFNNDRVDAGDIGAGHSVTALYEITPVGSPARLSDPLRYQPEEPMITTGELGYLKLRYKEPGEATSQLIERPFRISSGEASDDMRFAMAIAGFGQLLQDSVYLGDWGYEQAIELANGARGEDAYGYRVEAVRLMRLAQSLAE
ncbi:vWA domain-containing protein [Roseovarius sp. 2305UL8-3]|uniref:vWA domain-containing protein n=1 Tax=Roseovarius conchicola TaxID=3121636 RepID=UPI003528BDFD